MADDKPTRHGDLEIRVDARYHQKLWRFQRLGWVALALIALAALLGLFGGKGTLNNAVGDGDGLRIEYERFPHLDTRTALLVTISGNLASDSRFELRIDNGYLRAIRIEDITPQPLAARADSGELVLVFETLTPADSRLVVLPFVPKRSGVLTARVRTGHNTAPIRLTQFVYP